ncbi:Phosphate regulon sensor protein PhoR [Gammaproteobacteria bacterium]
MTTGLMAFILTLTLVALGLVILLAGQVRQRQRLCQWLKDPHREIPEATGAWQDIFSRLHRLQRKEQRVQHALDSHLNYFRQAAQALPDGIILLDGQGRIEWLNTSACRHFSLDKTRDLGTLAEQLIRHSGFYEYLADFRAGATTRTPLMMTRNGDHPRQVLSLLLVSFAEAGILILSRDITEIARTEIIRRDFISNVSHELRTPLTVISGFLEQLTEKGAPTGEVAHRILVLMDEQARRMNRLVEDLLTLSRLENASQPPRDEVVDVTVLMESLLTEGQALSAGRHVVELGTVTAGHVRGSTDELRSACSNLVSNAVRYTPAGGTITLGWYLDEKGPVFRVTDTGIGIPAEHIPRLTERFYRVDKGRSTATGGTGLGLAIVKHVLARHQGTLEIQSEIGRGSVFAARLPQERVLASKSAP